MENSTSRKQVVAQTYVKTVKNELFPIIIISLKLVILHSVLF